MNTGYATCVELLDPWENLCYNETLTLVQVVLSTLHVSYRKLLV